jgi:hypothetical protein
MSKHTLSRARVRKALDAMEVLLDHAQEVAADKDTAYRGVLSELRGAYNDARSEISAIDGDPIFVPSPEDGEPSRVGE